MKHHFINFLSDAGHSVSGYEHKLLEKFAAFVESFEAKQNEPAPVVEATAPAEPVAVVADPAPAPVAEVTPAADAAGINATSAADTAPATPASNA
jgi:hypothetical protein